LGWGIGEPNASIVEVRMTARWWEERVLSRGGGRRRVSGRSVWVPEEEAAQITKAWEAPPLGERLVSRVREQDGKDHIACADRASVADSVLWGTVRWKPHLLARPGDGMRGKGIRERPQENYIVVDVQGCITLA
jgi:hypothetical protein